MTASPLADPAALQLLATVDHVRAQLADAADRLRRVGIEAASVAAATDWQTPSARHFHTRAAAWRDEVTRLAAQADASGEDARWLSARIFAMIWAGLS